MKTGVLSFLALSGISLIASQPVLAHHSMSMYDSSREVTLKAVITEFDWANPHSHILFTVTDEHGNLEKWDAEGGGPHRLADHGWSKDSLKPGDHVTIVGDPNRDGSHTMRFVKVILQNGQELEGRHRRFLY